jgi:hypothetical protein
VTPSTSTGFHPVPSQIVHAIGGFYQRHARSAKSKVRGVVTARDAELCVMSAAVNGTVQA